MFLQTPFSYLWAALTPDWHIADDLGLKSSGRRSNTSPLLLKSDSARHRIAVPLATTSPNTSAAEVTDSAPGSPHPSLNPSSSSRGRRHLRMVRC
jgi:hypothetical protein